jgi:hypothetical protein
MPFTVRSHPFAAHSARLMQSAYRSIAGGLVRPPVGRTAAALALEETDELSFLLDHMRGMATGKDADEGETLKRDVIDTARAMLMAMRARVGNHESRLEAGLATALEQSYAPATDAEWDETDGQIDEFRFDVG